MCLSKVFFLKKNTGLCEAVCGKRGGAVTGPRSTTEEEEGPGEKSVFDCALKLCFVFHSPDPVRCLASFSVRGEGVTIGVVRKGCKINLEKGGN